MFFSFWFVKIAVFTETRLFDFLSVNSFDYYKFFVEVSGEKSRSLKTGHFFLMYHCVTFLCSLPRRCNFQLALQFSF